MKKVWSILLALVLVVSVAGCKSKPKATKLVIWAFTDELKKVVEDYKAANPGIEVTFSIIPNEEYPTKLRPVLRSGTGAPDIFLGEAAYVRRFALEGQWAKLTKEFPKMTKQYEAQAPAYVTDMGRDADGDIVAMSWQATPGGFFYKRSVAKEALGTDDPDEVSAMLADNTKLLETAEKLKAKGKFLLCGFGSWYRVAALLVKLVLLTEATISFLILLLLSIWISRNNFVSLVIQQKLVSGAQVGSVTWLRQMY